MTDCPMGSCIGCEYARDCAHPETQARVLRGEVARLTGALDDWDKERRQIETACGLAGGGIGLPLAEHVRQEVARAEAAEKRVEELEARPDTVTVTACSADVCPRLCALAERVTELEGALRRILDLRTRDNPVCGCGECSQCVARAALASGTACPPVDPSSGSCPEAEDIHGQGVRCRRTGGHCAALASGNGEVSHD